jgi:hypothetical protein
MQSFLRFDALQNGMLFWTPKCSISQPWFPRVQLWRRTEQLFLLGPCMHALQVPAETRHLTHGSALCPIGRLTQLRVCCTG